MLAKFNFRVTPRALGLLFGATMLYVVGVRYLLYLGDFAGFAGWLVEWVGPKVALFLLLAERALETLLFVVLPFRTHIQKRPSLVWATLGVSLVATYAANWAIWGLTVPALVLLALLHLFAAGIYFLFIWNDVPVKNVAKSA